MKHNKIKKISLLLVCLIFIFLSGFSYKIDTKQKIENETTQSSRIETIVEPKSAPKKVSFTSSIVVFAFIGLFYWIFSNKGGSNNNCNNSDVNTNTNMNKGTNTNYPF